MEFRWEEFHHVSALFQGSLNFRWSESTRPGHQLITLGDLKDAIVDVGAHEQRGSSVNCSICRLGIKNGARSHVNALVTIGGSDLLDSSQRSGDSEWDLEAADSTFDGCCRNAVSTVCIWCADNQQCSRAVKSIKCVQPE